MGTVLCWKGLFKGGIDVSSQSIRKQVQETHTNHFMHSVHREGAYGTTRSVDLQANRMQLPLHTQPDPTPLRAESGLVLGWFAVCVSKTLG